MEIYFYLIFFLGLSALFSGIEIAFVSSNKLRIELNKDSNSLSSRILAKFNADPSKFITSLLIGNNIALILFSIFMARQLTADIFNTTEDSFLLLFYQTIITTVVVLIFGEFFPKAIFRIAPHTFLQTFAIPLNYLIFLPLKPFASLFSGLSKFLIKKFQKEEFDEEKEVFTSIDLEFYIKEIAAGQASFEDDDEINTEIFEKALYLKDIKVRECMVPRTEIQAIDINATVEDLKNKFIETKHSRILIYEENIDNMMGYAHHIDIIKNPSSIRDIIFDLPVVPGTMSARNLMNIFTKQNKSIAYVVDEFGGTAGIVTLEDLLEEIFGEIQDEHDDDEFIEKKLDNDEYIFSGRLEIDYLNEKYNLELPEGDYETLAGFIISNHEDIPDEKETIFIDNFEITVISAEDNRIETIKLKVSESVDEQ